MKPVVSVVIPTRNRADLLTAAVTSLRAQTLDRWEAVVIDDGSDPDCIAREQELASTDERIVLLNRDGPPGANRCRNVGARAARAELVVFFDDDDLFSPACLEARVAVMQGSPELHLATFPYVRFRRAPGDLPPVSPHPRRDPIDEYLRIEPAWHTGGAIWRKGFLDRVGGWDERLSSWQDWEFGLRALALRPALERHDGPSFLVRIASEDHRNVSGAGWEARNVRSWALALGAAFERLRSTGLIDARRAVALAWLHLFVAERLVEVGDTPAAAALWRLARERALTTRLEDALGRAVLARARRPDARPHLRQLLAYGISFAPLTRALAWLR
jgi:glycosyltransferase involved in cell wall biosynthesis